MNVGLNSIQVLLEHVHLVNSDTLTCAFGSADGHDGFFVLSLVQAWHITRVQNCVDVLKHVLVNDLSVNKHEGGLFALNTTLQ